MTTKHTYYRLVTNDEKAHALHSHHKYLNLVTDLLYNKQLIKYNIGLLGGSL